MIIRKIQPKKIVNRKSLLVIVLLGVGIFIVGKIVSGLFSLISREPADMPFTLGASLTFAGKISVDNQFPHYTHSLLNDSGVKIGLKSPTINLNDYKNTNIQIVGRVKKYFKTTPVLEVDSIKFPKKSLIISNNRYFFVDDLIYLDFSTQPQLSAVRSGNSIDVVFGDKTVVSIERFLCSKILKSHNCASLITDYINNNKDSFESYRGYIFYKHGTGFWTTFDDGLFGYLFKNVSDDMILDISSMFKIVTKEFVLKNKLDLIQTHCKDTTTQLRTINPDVQFTYTDPYLLTLALSGLDKKKNSVSCMITFDLRNEWKVKDVQFTY